MYYFNEAATLYNTHKLPEAEAAADKAIAADPKRAEAYYIKGQALIPQAKYDEATKTIHRALRDAWRLTRCICNLRRMRCSRSRCEGEFFGGNPVRRVKSTFKAPEEVNRASSKRPAPGRVRPRGLSVSLVCAPSVSLCEEADEQNSGWRCQLRRGSQDRAGTRGRVGVAGDGAGSSAGLRGSCAGGGSRCGPGSTSVRSLHARRICGARRRSEPGNDLGNDQGNDPGNDWLRALQGRCAPESSGRAAR